MNLTDTFFLLISLSFSTAFAQKAPVKEFFGELMAIFLTTRWLLSSGTISQQKNAFVHIHNHYPVTGINGLLIRSRCKSDARFVKPWQAVN